MYRCRLGIFVRSVKRGRILANLERDVNEGDYDRDRPNYFRNRCYSAPIHCSLSVSGPSEQHIRGHWQRECLLLAEQRTAENGRFLRSLDFRLLGQFKGIVDLDSKVSNGALKLCMTKEKLDRSQVLRAPIDQCCLRSAHRMRPV